MGVSGTFLKEHRDNGPRWHRCCRFTADALPHKVVTIHQHTVTDPVSIVWHQMQPVFHIRRFFLQLNPWNKTNFLNHQFFGIKAFVVWRKCSPYSEKEMPGYLRWQIYVKKNFCDFHQESVLRHFPRLCFHPPHKHAILFSRRGPWLTLWAACQVLCSQVFVLVLCAKLLGSSQPPLHKGLHHSQQSYLCLSI